MDSGAIGEWIRARGSCGVRALRRRCRRLGGHVQSWPVSWDRVLAVSFVVLLVVSVPATASAGGGWATQSGHGSPGDRIDGQADLAGHGDVPGAAVPTPTRSHPGTANATGARSDPGNGTAGAISATTPRRLWSAQNESSDWPLLETVSVEDTFLYRRSIAAADDTGDLVVAWNGDPDVEAPDSEYVDVSIVADGAETPAISDDGSLVGYAAGPLNDSNVYRIENATTRERVATIEPQGWVQAAAFDGTGSHLALLTKNVTSGENDAVVYNTTTWEVAFEETVGPVGYLRGTAFSPDDDYVGFTRAGGEVGLYDTDTWQRTTVSGNDSSANDMDFGGEYFAHTDGRGVEVYSYPGFEKVKQIEEGTTDMVALSQDGDYLAYYDGEVIVIRETRTWTSVATLGDRTSPNDLEFSSERGVFAYDDGLSDTVYVHAIGAFQYAPDEPTPGDPVAFAATTDAAEYEWSIDGERVGTGATLVYEFDDTGEYEVSLTTVEDGNATTSTRTVEVVPIVVGSVEDQQGDRVGNATVLVGEATDRGWFFPGQSPSYAAETTTDKNGTFAIDELAPGGYNVRVVPPEDAAAPNSSYGPRLITYGQQPPYNLTLTGPLEELEPSVETLENSSRELIDDHTNETAGVYVEGYRTFEDGSLVGDVAPTSLSDIVQLSIDIVDEGLDRDTVKGVLKGGGWDLVDSGIHRMLNKEFRELDAEDRQRFAETSARLGEEEWLLNTEYTDDRHRAYEQGYTESAVYLDAQDRLDESSQAFDEIEETADVGEEFQRRQASALVRRQTAWLRDERNMEGIVITPEGNVVYHSQSDLERERFERARGRVATGNAAGSLFDWTALVGSAVALLPGPGTVVGGIVAAASGAAGRIASLFELSAKAQMAVHWSNSNIYWAQDLDAIPQVHEDTVEWLEDEVEDPSIHQVDGTITEARLELYEYDSPLDRPRETEGPLPVLLCHVDDRVYYNDRTIEVSVENTGPVEADTRVTTEVLRADTERTDGSVDQATVISAATDTNDEPVTLAPGEEWSGDVGVVALEDRERTPEFNNYWLRTRVWMDGVVVDQRLQSVQFRRTQGVQLEDIRACTGDASGPGTDSTDVAAGTGRSATDAVAGVDPDASFGAYTPNETVLAAVDLSPNRTVVERTVEVNETTNRLDLTMFAGSDADVTLAAVGPDGTMTGYDIGTGEPVEGIPNSTYSGRGQSGESISIEDPPASLTVRATARSFSSARNASVYLDATEHPERPALIDARVPGAGVAVSRNDSVTIPVSIGELGGEEGAESVTIEAVPENPLPDGVTVGLDETNVSLTAGGNASVALDVETAEESPNQSTRVPIAIEVTAADGVTSDATASLLVVDGAPGLSVRSTTGVIDRFDVEHTDDIADGPPEGHVLQRGYDVARSGNGSVTVEVETTRRPADSALFAVENGSWTRIDTIERDGSVLGTVPGADVDAVALTYERPTPAYYSDPATGTVETEGLRRAVSDWQRGEIDSATLQAVIEAWASGDPVA